MPRASWAINRFLIFSPSISWVSVSDGWCDRERRPHKFRILNTKSVHGSWVQKARSPSSCSHHCMRVQRSIPAPPEVWQLLWFGNRQSPCAILLIYEASIGIHDSEKMGFSEPEGQAQGHMNAEMNKWLSCSFGGPCFSWEWRGMYHKLSFRALWVTRVGSRKKARLKPSLVCIWNSPAS